MGQSWRHAEPYMRAVAYLVDESRRDDIPLIHDRLRKAETDMAHQILEYLLSPTPDGQAVSACSETMQAVNFILGRLDELSDEELITLARRLQAECAEHIP